MAAPPTSVRAEPAALAGAFAGLLAAEGLRVGPDRAARFARALRLDPPVTRDRCYWLARTTLVADRSALEIFDRVFTLVFDRLEDPADTRGETSAPPPIRARGEHAPRGPATEDGGEHGATEAGAARAPGEAGEDDGGSGTEHKAVLAAASRTERLRHTDFAALTADELDEVRRLVASLALAPPPRRTRRRRPAAHRGRVDLRRTLRRAHRTGGDPLRLARRRRRERPRRLVLLCDVSGSMEPYTRVFLTLLHDAVRRADAEAFVFATRLTRLTRPLRVRDPDAALARAARAAPDWAGGTRLGASLKAFVDGHGRRGLARGAVILVVSDGWEPDDPAEVARQMERLARLAHRVVWVNPRKAAPGFAPLAGGMAAALPHCDAFVSGHRAAALSELVSAVAGTSKKRSTP